jgi:hypothetical protein
LALAPSACFSWILVHSSGGPIHDGRSNGGLLDFLPCSHVCADGKPEESQEEEAINANGNWHGGEMLTEMVEKY